MKTKSKWVVTIFLSVFLNENTWHVLMKFDIALKQVQSSLKQVFRRTFRAFYGMISTVFVTLLLVYLLKLLF
jgi:hypothetical protein